MTTLSYLSGHLLTRTVLSNDAVTSCKSKCGLQERDETGAPWPSKRISLESILEVAAKFSGLVSSRNMIVSYL